VILRRRSGSLRQEFLQQRLENKEDDKRQKKDEEKPALGAGFLLRIFEVRQSFITVSSSWRAHRVALFYEECFSTAVARITGSYPLRENG
jgi:hypothetical protein